jgi:integrase
LVYRSRLIVFLKFIYPTELIDTRNLDNYADRYFTENREFKKDVEQYLVSIKSSPPLTQRNYLVAIKVMLDQNNHDLPTIAWRNFRRSITGTRAWTPVKIPTYAQLKQLLMNMPIAGRALFITLAVSGMRIGEALKLKDENINLKSNPVKITIPGQITKNGDPRITFVT